MKRLSLLTAALMASPAFAATWTTTYDSTTGGGGYYNGITASVAFNDWGYTGPAGANANTFQVGTIAPMTANDIAATMALMGAAARAASTTMAASPTAARNAALRSLANRLRAEAAALQAVNARDLDAARAAGLAAPLVDRLKLGAEAIETCALGCEQIAAIPDPIGEISELKRQPSGIAVGRMRVPLGVFGMIYESRPNVTIEAASLAIKSGNACILRGGSEAFHSNQALARLVQESPAEAGLP